MSSVLSRILTLKWWIPSFHEKPWNMSKMSCVFVSAESFSFYFFQVRGFGWLGWGNWKFSTEMITQLLPCFIRFCNFFVLLAYFSVERKFLSLRTRVFEFSKHAICRLSQFLYILLVCNTKMLRNFNFKRMERGKMPETKMILNEKKSVKFKILFFMTFCISIFAETASSSFDDDHQIKRTILKWYYFVWGASFDIFVNEKFKL